MCGRTAKENYLMDNAEHQRKIQEEIEKLEAKIREADIERKIESWHPWPHQKGAFDYFLQGRKVILLQGGNRIGKTVFGVCVVGSACLGIHPWDGTPTIFGPVPVRARIIAVDWEHHAREVIVPVLKEWLPKGTYATLKNNVGVEAYWNFPETQSTLELMTHSQETRQHEGWKGHIVWSDEPLPKDKYTANRRGLIDYSGVFIMTMTALYEPWILDEIVLNPDLKVGAITEIPMSANPLLQPEDIKNFSDGLTEDEREVRIGGAWLQRMGLVLKEFKRDIHVVKNFSVPTDWPVVPIIDIHLNKPQAVGFYGWDKFDRQFVVDEIWENLSPEEIADEIIRRKFNFPRMKTAYIDPLAKGDNAYVKNRINIEDTFSIVEKKLLPHGIRLESASKDKSSGIRNIKRSLTGANGMPSLFIMEKCKQHIWEVQRWIFDKDGLPQKENDHFMENLYRSTLTGMKYTALDKFTGDLKQKSVGIV